MLSILQSFRVANPLFRVTNSDGRCLDLLPPIETSDETKELVKPGLYKIVFKVKEYYEKKGLKCFYPWVEVCNLILYMLCCLEQRQR